MRSIIKKLLFFVTHVQVLSVLLAFALMVFLSYSYMSGIERKHLLNNVNNAFYNTQKQIASDMMETETTLGVIAGNIRYLILRGDDLESINNYLKDTAGYLSGLLMAETSDVFGFFQCYDNAFISGMDREYPGDYMFQERPWYTAAVEAGGSVGTTEPYLRQSFTRYANMEKKSVIITFARQIFDDAGNPLAVICLDVLMDRINEFAVNTSVTEGSYGILFDKNFNVLAHPVPEKFLGRNISLMNDGEQIKNKFLQDGEISGMKVLDYDRNESVGFFRRLDNGWSLGIIAYSDTYYQSVKDIGIRLTILGAALALILISILLRVVSGKRTAEERVKIMLNSVPLCINLWDKSCNIIDCNQEAVNLYELSGKKEYIDRFFDLSPVYQPNGGLSSEMIINSVKTAFDSGYCRFEWMHRKLNGEPMPSDVTLVRVKYRDEDIVCGYIRDMREISAAVTQLREADERNMIMLDGAPIGVLMWNEKHELIDFNYEAARVLGIYSKEEFRSRFFETMPEYQSDGRLSADEIRRFISKIFREGAYHGVWNHNTVGGETIPFDALGLRLVLREDPVAVIYTHDLRELNKANAKMREADECTQVMFDATPLSCFMLDNKFKIVDCNQEITRLLGLKSKKDYINHVYDFFPEYQPTGQLSLNYIKNYTNEAFDEGYCRFELMHRKTDGELIPAEVTLVRVKYRGEYALAGYIRDLRELKAMIVEMRRAETAEESSKAKSDFLARMSHEIRTPMNAILGITEIQLQDNSLPLITREALERIYNSGDLLLGIINDILDLSKIEAGRLELNIGTYDVASLIHDTVKLNIMRYESKPVEFKLTVGVDVPSLLIGDELRIKQILNNLLSNAFKYTHEGMVELTLGAETTDKSSFVNLVIRVSDTGQGMTAEQVSKLGDKYSRFNQEANRNTEGTGLGMNITRNLVQLMNGAVLIESTPGAGSVFTVHLPQECANSVMIGAELAENLMKLNLKNTTRMRNAQITQDFMPYGRVLIVDDVETNLYVARGLMAPYGISVDTAVSGFDAVKKIRDGSSYDIVFMDHMMPGMDGIEAAKQIRALGYISPIVALTANAIAGQAEMFINNGFDDFISKPIDIRQLNATLNKLIRDKQPPEVIDEARRQKNNLFAAGLRNAAPDSQLAEYFIHDAKKAIGILSAIYKNNCRRADDISAFIVNVHALKSALANVGESELSNRALDLEMAGRENNISLILTCLPEFLESLNEIVEKLNPEEDDEAKGGFELLDEEDRSYLRGNLLVIKEACATFDKKTVKNALAGLKKKKWPLLIKNQLAEISENLLHSEFDEVSDKAGEIISAWFADSGDR